MPGDYFGVKSFEAKVALMEKFGKAAHDPGSPG
jgi:hypothetical protein